MSVGKGMVWLSRARGRYLGEQRGLGNNGEGVRGKGKGKGRDDAGGNLEGELSSRE